jgi:S1-C subfamily serine protease
MPVQASCPSCKTTIRLLEGQLGVPLTCPQCQCEWLPDAADLRRVPPPLPPAAPQKQAVAAVPQTASAAALQRKSATPPTPPPVPRKKEVVHEPEFLPSDPALSLPPMKPKKATRTEAKSSGALQQWHGLPARTRLFVAIGSVGAVVMLGIVFVAVAVAVFRKPSDASTPTAPSASNDPLTGEQVYQRLIRCSTLIATSDSIGSGFVVSTDKRYVVTNEHVVGSAKEVAVIFPLYDDKAELVTDARKYKAKAKDVAVKGEVIEVDTTRDLALIKLERVPPKVEAVTFARKAAPTGGVVYSVGNSGAVDAPGVEGNLLWRLTKGTVRGRVERRTGTTQCMILETDAPVNPGDSGGPVVNDRAELVGVVSHFLTKQRQVSGNIDIDELRKFLEPHLKP